MGQEFAGVDSHLKKAAEKHEVDHDLAAKASASWHVKQITSTLGQIAELHNNPHAAPHTKDQMFAYVIDIAGSAIAMAEGCVTAVADMARLHGLDIKADSDSPVNDLAPQLNKFRAKVQKEQAVRDKDNEASDKDFVPQDQPSEEQVLREADMIPKPPNPEVEPDHTPPGETPSPEQLEREADMVPKVDPPVIENRPKPTPDDLHPVPKPESIADPHLPTDQPKTPLTVPPAKPSHPHKSDADAKAEADHKKAHDDAKSIVPKHPQKPK